MGGDARSLILPLPIGERGTSSWAQHQRRIPRSTEPGTDIFAPTGTPVLAPADGVIYGYGESVAPATGRWVGIDFDNGMSFRCMHHSRILRKGGRVKQGDEIALSGSSGYGSDFFGQPSRNDAFWRDTGGDHSHVTLWPSRDKRFGYGRDGNPNKPYTVDIMDFIRLDSLAGGGATPLPKGFLMALTDKQQEELYNAVARIDQNAEAAADRLRGPKDRKVDMLQSIEGIVSDLHERFVVDADGDGTKDFDLTQIVRNQVQPALEAILAAVLTGRKEDVAALAATLAPILAPLLGSMNLGTLSRETIDDLVKRLLDEQARRLAS